MDVYEKGLITVLGCSLVGIIITLPLILRKVPRNVIYGYRTRASLRNDYVWYEASAYFGRGFLIANVTAAVMVSVIYLLEFLSPLAFLYVSISILIAPVLIAALKTSRFLRTLSEDDPDRYDPGRG